MHVITGLTVGGAENQLVHIARHSRHELGVVCLDNFGAPGEQLVAMGTRVLNLRVSGRFDLRVIVRLVRVIRRWYPDVVHVHLLRAGLHARIAARLARVPVIVYTEHSIGVAEIEELPATTALRALYRATSRLSDVTIAVSPWVRERVRAWGVDGPTTVIENGVDVEAMSFSPIGRQAIRAELGIPAEATVITTVGRMVARKQQSLLVHGAAPLVRDGAWLLLVGDGPLRVSLKREVDALGIGERTRFTGIREDVAPILSASDVFASLAAEEMYGLAPVEAMASGLPVVVRHCPPLEGEGPPRVHWTGSDPATVQSSLRAAVQDSLSQRGAVDHMRGGRHEVRTTVARLDTLYETLFESSSLAAGSQVDSVVGLVPLHPWLPQRLAARTMTAPSYWPGSMETAPHGPRLLPSARSAVRAFAAPGPARGGSWAPRTPSPADAPQGGAGPPSPRTRR